jgi:hypothetical protein
MERYRYLDLMRVVAIGGVVYGHWLLVDVTYSGGRLSGRDAVDYVSWGRWVTWAFQVMPVFFLVGGYVYARSWTEHHARGESGRGGCVTGSCGCGGRRRYSWWRRSWRSWRRGLR